MGSGRISRRHARRRVADFLRDPAEPASAPAHFSESDGPWLRQSVAGNPSTPSRCLETLSERSEGVLMSWSFVGRTHDDMVRARRDWREQSGRLGEVVGDAGESA